MTMRTMKTVHELDDHHRVRFVKGGGQVIGLMLDHDRRIPLENAGEDYRWEPCEPGLVQWEPYGTIRPIFTLHEEHKQVTLTPTIVCLTCGDRGQIVDGKWLANVSVDPGLLPDGEFAMDTTAAVVDEYEDESDSEEEGPQEPREDRLNLREYANLRFQEDDAEMLRRGLRVEGFDLKDSGERRVLPTGAQRDRQVGKGRYDLFQFFAMPRITAILEAGATKYGDRNWEKGMPVSWFIDSAFRHLSQYMMGMRDEDHLGQATWNLLCAVSTEVMISRGILPDDLYDIPGYFPATGGEDGAGS